MPRRVEGVYADILEAIEGITNALGGRTFDEFANDWLLKHGVQRGIEIISESSRHLPDELKAFEPIAAIGNVFRHEYHRVSDRAVWNTVQRELPRLRSAIISLRDGNAGVRF
jgi:uncharacterized protein with HEPN domain